MKNSDMPANSTSLEISNRYEEGHYDQVALGLTKREAFSLAAMQGLLSANAMYNGKTDDRVSLAQDAIETADALLAELEK